MKGIGIDLCEVKRIEHALQKGEAFLQRFYTAEERAYIASRGAVGAQSAAAIFAAKEAFLKAVSAGLGGGIAMDEIGVCHRASGAPYYLLTGNAQKQLEALGATAAFLSLTHEAGVAAAVCVID